MRVVLIAGLLVALTTKSWAADFGFSGDDLKGYLSQTVALNERGGNAQAEQILMIQATLKAFQSSPNIRFSGEPTYAVEAAAPQTSEHSSISTREFTGHVDVFRFGKPVHCSNADITVERTASYDTETGRLYIEIRSFRTTVDPWEQCV